MNEIEKALFPVWILAIGLSFMLYGYYIVTYLTFALSILFQIYFVNSIKTVNIRRGKR